MRKRTTDTVIRPEIPKLWAPPISGGGGGTLLVLCGAGASCLYEGHIYFEQNMAAK
jgi:hypothetical protein